MYTHSVLLTNYTLKVLPPSWGLPSVYHMKDLE